jgi:hypothetical protein
VLSLDDQGAQAVGRFETAADADAFRFTASASGTLSFTPAADSGRDLVIDVYDSSGHRPVAAQSLADDPLRLAVVSGESYYLLLRSSIPRASDYVVALDWLLGGSA